jgi:RimJ/RimL family protein N-acetyltransferase
VSRRLARPEPSLADKQVRLEPMTQADHADLLALTADDAVKQFTYVPTGADPEFISRWIGRYEHGWEDGSCAGFVVRDAASGAFLAFAALVHLDLTARQGEIGYAVAPAARGRGVAGRAVDLLTRWAFDELALVRLELQIDVANPASERVAARSGYSLEGVRRSLYFKEGRRADSGIWSRLRDDLPVA